MKVSKILGMFSRIRPSLILEDANRLFKAMVPPVLDYCDTVWHECGQGNSDKIERLKDEHRGSSTSKLPQNYHLIKLWPNWAWNLSIIERRTHTLRFVNESIANRVPKYLFSYFDVRNRRKTRNNNDFILEKVNLECSKWHQARFFLQRCKNL